MVGAIAILGELVPPRERGKHMGYIMAVMMIATIGGPLVGGFLVKHLSWRWVFYINLPIGGAALVYLSRVLKLPTHRTEHVIDYLGAVLLAVAATSIVLVTTWGGSEYPWASPEIIGLAVVGVASVAWFLWAESHAVEPMLPLHLFRIRNFSLVAALSFLVGLAMFGAITFLPLYQQTVQGASATVSGLLLTPMMIGVMVTSIIAGQVTSRTGRYKILPILGSAGMGVGMFLLTQLGPATSRVTSGLFFVVLGLGMGLLMQTTSLMAQNSVELKDIGVASSSRIFFQQIGGSIGVSVFGALFARQLTGSLSPPAARPRACTSPTASSTRPRSACCPRRSAAPVRGHRARDRHGVHLGDPGHDRSVRGRPVHQEIRCAAYPTPSRRPRPRRQSWVGRARQKTPVLREAPAPPGLCAQMPP